MSSYRSFVAAASDTGDEMEKEKITKENRNKKEPLKIVTARSSTEVNQYLTISAAMLSSKNVGVSGFPGSDMNTLFKYVQIYNSQVCLRLESKKLMKNEQQCNSGFEKQNQMNFLNGVLTSSTITGKWTSSQFAKDILLTFCLVTRMYDTQYR